MSHGLFIKNNDFHFVSSRVCCVLGTDDAFTRSMLITYCKLIHDLPNRIGSELAIVEECIRTRADACSDTKAYNVYYNIAFDKNGLFS